MSNANPQIPDSSAVRVALWRAMHVLIDQAPHVIEDMIGLKLIDPDENWRNRPDMHPMGTRGYRASIVGRARFIEDLVEDGIKNGIGQFIILGAGLDTFVQRKPELISKIKVFEIDQSTTLVWKQQRLIELGFGIPSNLQFVPVNFESNESWWDKLLQCGFDSTSPAVVASTGVAMYLTKEVIINTMRQLAKLPAGSKYAMSFLLPLELLPAEERAQLQAVQQRAREAGTPFVSFYSPSEILSMAKEAGFKKTEHISRDNIIQRYFAGRSDGLVPSTGEELLVATT